jgi:hypothetical protein
MNKLTIKKTKLWLVAGYLSLAISAPANALIPVTDIANLAENIAGNIQDMYNWVEQKRLLLMQMDQVGISSEMDIDNTNNAIANVIVRTGKATQEVQNIEILEKSAPDKDAPGTIAVQAMNKEASCFSADRVVSQLDSFHTKNGNYSSNPSEQQKQAKEIAKKIVTECEVLQDGVVDPKNPLATSLCTRADILLGGRGATYTADESKAAEKMAELIVGPTPLIKTSSGFEGADEAKRQILQSEMRKEGFRATAYTSMAEIRAINESPDRVNHSTPSVLETLEQFDNERFGSADWLATIQNVNPEKKNSVYPSEVIRKMAVMDAFLVHMSLLQYKQSLRAEALQAADLAYTLNPAR